MKLTYKLLFILVIVFIAYLPCLAQIEAPNVDWGAHPMEYSRVGTAGWQFLKLPTNARTAAMGGVNSAIGYGDASSALTNPASIADVQNIDVTFSYMDWVADIGLQTISAVKNMKKWGVFGINLLYLDYGDMERTENMEVFDGAQKSLGITPVFSGLGTFSAGDLAVGLAYARQITDKLQVGGNFKYVQETLDDAKTGNWALDIGTLYYTGIKTLRISMLGKSFGPDAEFASYSERIERTPIKVKMPMMFTCGAAMDVVEAGDDGLHRLIVAGEYIHPNDGPDKFNLGTEYVFMEMFSLRTGYRFNYDEEGITFGGGLNFEMKDIAAHFNYAYLDVGLFNQVHMFTFGMSL